MLITILDVHQHTEHKLVDKFQTNEDQHLLQNPDIKETKKLKKTIILTINPPRKEYRCVPLASIVKPMYYSQNNSIFILVILDIYNLKIKGFIKGISCFICYLMSHYNNYMYLYLY